MQNCRKNSTECNLSSKKRRRTPNFQSKFKFKSRSQWESLRKERDFHKENFLKTVTEKENIAHDIKALENQHEDFISKTGDLQLKYEHLCKSKSLMKLEKERLFREKDAKTAEILKLQQELERVSHY